MEKKEITPVNIRQLTETQTATVLKKYFSLTPIDYVIIALLMIWGGALLAVFVRWLVVTYVL
ncbi:hypothetical protein KAW18_02450 [candidate division WOR-3 bacterium]|nr:hypothetical protein [candidate division WOR-3 bacterium]